MLATARYERERSYSVGSPAGRNTWNGRSQHPEFSMPPKVEVPLVKVVPPRPPSCPLPEAQAKPTEPSEVLGRHKNTGQKDHKGAR